MPQNNPFYRWGDRGSKKPVAKNPGLLTLNPIFFLVTPLGIFYPTRESLALFVLFTAMYPAPTRVPGTHSVLDKCFSNEWVQQGAGRSQPNALLYSWGTSDLERVWLECDLSSVTLCLSTIESIIFSLPVSPSLLPDLSRQKMWEPLRHSQRPC